MGVFGVFQAWIGVFGDSFLVLFFLRETSGGVGGGAEGFSWGEVSRGGGGEAMGRGQLGGGDGELSRNAAHTEMTLKPCKRSKCLRLLERIVSLCRIAVAPIKRSKSDIGVPAALKRRLSLANMRHISLSTDNTTKARRNLLNARSLSSGSGSPKTPS